MLPRVAPGGESIELEIDAQLQGLGAKPETRDLADGTNGIVELTQLHRPFVRSEVVVGWNEPVSIAAGELPDGRALTLEVRVRKTSSGR